MRGDVARVLHSQSERDMRENNQRRVMLLDRAGMNWEGIHCHQQLATVFTIKTSHVKLFTTLANIQSLYVCEMCPSHIA